MNIKTFINLVSLSILTISSPLVSWEQIAPINYRQESYERLAWGKKTLYRNAIQEWPKLVLEPSILNLVLEDLKTLGSGVLSEKQVEQLLASLTEDFQKGTCYGEALNFLVLNGPNQTTVTMPSDINDKKRAMLIQSMMNLGKLYKNQYDQAKINSLTFIRSHNIAIEEEKEWSSIMKKLINEENNTFDNNQDFILAKMSFLEMTAWQNLIDRLENEIALQIAANGIHELPKKTIQRNILDNDTFAKNVLNAIQQRHEEGADSFLFLVDFKLKDGSKMGHAILVHIRNLQIYDSKYGVFQYDSFENLSKDLIRNAYTEYTYSVSINAYASQEIALQVK